MWEQAVVFGFPFETIEGETQRVDVMAAILEHLNVEEEPGPDPGDGSGEGDGGTGGADGPGASGGEGATGSGGATSGGRKRGRRSRR